jgi:acyl-[acyl-carrier-protein] desaturase
MASSLRPEDPAVRAGFYKLYRDFFNRAEKKRRWSIADDIPWDQVNRGIDPAVADVIESFCAVEMYLPDYVAKSLPMIRTNMGWAWFHVNWGYEESKHSLAMRDWLLLSGARTDEQMADIESTVFAHEWNLPHDNPAGMLVYAMVQELATWIHYRNLRHHVDRHGDPALSKLLGLIAVDERAHHSFYLRLVKMFLELDRPGTLEQLRRVILTFAMPAVHLLADSRRRAEAIRSLGIFTEDIFLHEVYGPILTALEIDPRELRTRPAKKKADTVATR